MASHRILLVSDTLNSPENRALRQALDDQGEFELVGEAGLLPALARGGCRLLILDASCLESRSDELIQAIKKEFPGLQVVVMTAAPHWKVARAVIRAGGDYLEKSQDPKILRFRFTMVLEDLSLVALEDSQA
jgi:DNA-binding NarL/FixJ family response regulator